MTNITLFSQNGAFCRRFVSFVGSHLSPKAPTYPIEISLTSKISVEKGFITPAPLAP